MTQERDSAGYVAERLGRIAGALAPGGTGVADVVRLTAGASLQTWAFDVATPAGPVPLILRRRRSTLRDESDDFGTALPLAIESRLLERAAAGGVTVATLVRLCTPEDELDEAYVVARIAGETLGRRIATDARFAPARAVLAGQCGAALAQIHALDPDPALVTSDAAGVLAKYEAIWRAAGLARPAIEAAFRWLAARIPDPVPVRLVHGDFRNGNIMVDADRGLVAVLDWELAHRGDPAEDFGWLCANSWRFGVPGKPVGGFGELPDLIAGYAAAGGVPPSADRIAFWQMLSSLKWGVMTTTMFASFASGDNSSPERAVIGRRLSETEADVVAIMRRSA